VADAYKIMGERKFYQQIMQDEYIFQKFKIADHMDVVTVQDYMQVRSLYINVENSNKKFS
jgi:hypothetical protein